jgi:hypothetical protein
LCEKAASFDGEYDLIVRLLEEFVVDLRDCGLEPVFFFDGVFKPLKKATQLLRRQEEVKKLNNGKKKESVIILPLLVKEVVLQHLRALGVEINQTLEEADQSICVYNLEHREHVFGVLSNDSDFLVLDVTFLPISKFCKKRNGDFRFAYFERMQTAKILGLKNPNHFFIFSCLCGNDYTKLELLKFQNYKKILAKLGNQADRNSQFKLIRNVVRFCNDFLGQESNVPAMLGVLDDMVFKNYVQKSQILKIFLSSLKIIMLNDAGSETFLQFPPLFQEAFYRGKIDNSLLDFSENLTFWSRICRSGQVEIFTHTQKIRQCIFSRLTTTADAVIIEYFQANCTYYESRSNFQRLPGQDLAAFWKDDSSYRHNFMKCLEGVLKEKDDDEEGKEGSDLAGIFELDPKIRLSIVALKFLLHQNCQNNEDPILFSWEFFILLAYIVSRKLQVPVRMAEEGEKSEAFSKKISLLLKKIPKRSVFLGCFFQRVVLNWAFLFQISNCFDAENLLCFNESDFHEIYHLIYSRILLQRSSSSEPWQDRLSSESLAGECVEKLLENNAEAKQLFGELKEMLFKEQEFKSHFPDEFEKVKNSATKKQKKEARVFEKAMKQVDDNNQFDLLRFIPGEK